jgi:hypothetical protein
VAVGDGDGSDGEERRHRRDARATSDAEGRDRISTLDPGINTIWGSTDYPGRLTLCTRIEAKASAACSGRRF